MSDQPEAPPRPVVLRSLALCTNGHATVAYLAFLQGTCPVCDMRDQKDSEIADLQQRLKWAQEHVSVFAPPRNEECGPGPTSTKSTSAENRK